MTPEEIAAMQAALKAAQESIAALTAKNQELITEKKTAKQKADEASLAAEKAAEEAALKGKDVDALNKSWEAKYTKLNEQLTQTNDKFSQTVKKNGLESALNSVLGDAELFDPKSAGLARPHLMSRLDVQVGEDGSFKTVVKDKEGNLSAMTIDELKKEIRETPEFAPILAGTGASGGGSGGGKTAAQFSGAKEAVKNGMRTKEEMRAEIEAAFN